MNKQLISYCGYLGSGKGYVSQKHISDLKFDGNSVFLTAWADPLKFVMAETMGVLKSGINDNWNPNMPKSELKDRIGRGIFNIYSGMHPLDRRVEFDEKVMYKFDTAWRKYGEEVFELYRTLHITNHKHNQRKLIQLVGTELGRAVDPDLWINATLERVKKVFDMNICDHVIIDDARFLNEYRAILEFGKLEGVETKIYGIEASRETRARRRNMTIEEVAATETHQSEYETAEILKMIPKDCLIQNDQDD